MSNFTVTIEAHEICEAIKALTSAILSYKPAQPVQAAPAPVIIQPIPAAPVPVPTAAPAQAAVPAPIQTSTIPTAAPTYTADQLAIAATQLMDAGKRPDLVSLLKSFGVAALTMLPKEQYGAFATALRELGAKI